METNNSLITDAKELFWSDFKDIAMGNREEDIHLYITI
jgi:hypothetical protein